MIHYSRTSCSRSVSNWLPPCRARFHFLNSRVLDIKLIRDKTDFVRSRLATRGAGDEVKIDKIILRDTGYKSALAMAEMLRQKRKQFSKEIGDLIKSGNPQLAENKKDEVAQINTDIKVWEDTAASDFSEREVLMLQLPNLPHESIPLGKTAEDNPEVRVHGAKQNFDFKPKSHVELCDSLKLVEIGRAHV